CDWRARADPHDAGHFVQHRCAQQGARRRSPDCRSRRARAALANKQGSSRRGADYDRAESRAVARRWAFREQRTYRYDHALDARRGASPRNHRNRARIHRQLQRDAEPGPSRMVPAPADSAERADARGGACSVARARGQSALVTSALLRRTALDRELGLVESAAGTAVADRSGNPDSNGGAGRTGNGLRDASHGADGDSAMVSGIGKNERGVALLAVLLG